MKEFENNALSSLIVLHDFYAEYAASLSPDNGKLYWKGRLRVLQTSDLIMKLKDIIGDEVQ